MDYKAYMLLILLCLVCFQSAAAQSSANDSIRLILIYPDKEVADTLYPDSQKAVDSILYDLQSAGYLLPHKIDASKAESELTYFTGHAAVWGKWHLDETTAFWFRRAGVNPNHFQNRPIGEVSLAAVFMPVIKQLENNGFPFASLRIDSISKDNELLEAFIGLETGPLIRYRNLVMPDKQPVNALFLTRYLGILPGQPYRERDILEINNRLQDLEYLQVSTPPSVQFTGEEATVFIFPERRPANRFDFILGILPAPAGANDDRRVQITGTADLLLLNPWRTGQSIGFSFRQTRPETQEMRFHFDYPYVMGLPFGSSVAFDLYKRDTTFLDIHWQAAIQYAFSGRHYLEVFWNNHRSNLLSIPAQQIINSRTLPSSLDLSRNSFGLRYVRERFDYRFNPGRGYSWNVSIAAGLREVRRNSLILNLTDPEDPTFDYATLYNEFEKPQIQWSPTFEFKYFQPLGGMHVLHFHTRALAIFSTQEIKDNERFRLGGFQTMRGFDEESIITPAFVFARLEYRYLLDRNAHFHLFSDHGFAPETSNIRELWLWYTGLGAGIQFETPVGVFGVSYALGRRSDLGFDLRTGKIHFGYANLF